MATIAGIFTGIKVQHSVVGNQNFDMKSGEDTELDRGGLRIVDDENNRTASGKLILQYENKQPYIQPTVVVDADIEQYIQDLIANSFDELGTWTLTHISGDVYSGRGTIVGDVRPNRNAGTVQFKIVFEDELLKL